MANIFHVLNRGVDKREIFLDKQDYFRFIHDLYELNNQELANNNFRVFDKMNDLRGRSLEDKKPRKLLVHIHAFALMPNHFHLLLSPKTDNGISRFMQKVNVGYVKYFNQKYEREGTLLQGRTKKILISDESHFIHLPYYIHLNPLDLFAPEWRERKLKDLKGAIKFLENYRWSSHLDYLGIKNFPSVTNRDFLLKYFGDENAYKQLIKDWLKDLEVENFKEVVLE